MGRHSSCGVASVDSRGGSLEALMYMRPQVCAAIAIVPVAYPDAQVYARVPVLVDAGFDDCTLYGSDQAVWPELIQIGSDLARVIERKIPCDHAAPFLRIDLARTGVLKPGPDDPCRRRAVRYHPAVNPPSPPKSPDDSATLTAQLNAAQAGDRDAAERALGQVYAELKRIAGGILRGNPLTLDATSLAHDAFLRLVPEAERPFADRRHFFRLAARAMRQILVDHVRARSADKRGGGFVHTQLTERIAADGDDPLDLLALDAALDRLQARDSELAEIVEAYFFAGFTFEEIAELSQSSERSVRRQWEVARLFLLRELRAP